MQFKATGVMDMWPMGTIFSVANNTTPKRSQHTGSAHRPEPYVISDSSGSSDVQGVLGSATAPVRIPKPRPRGRP